MLKSTKETTAQKIARISAMQASYRFRLAAILATGTDKGKMWT